MSSHSIFCQRCIKCQLVHFIPLFVVWEFGLPGRLLDNMQDDVALLDPSSYFFKPRHNQCDHFGCQI